jgi:hypothetical protein
MAMRLPFGDQLVHPSKPTHLAAGGIVPSISLMRNALLRSISMCSDLQ